MPRTPEEWKQLLEKYVARLHEMLQKEDVSLVLIARGITSVQVVGLGYCGVEVMMQALGLPTDWD